jgi:hypothetical protein
VGQEYFSGEERQARRKSWSPAGFSGLTNTHSYSRRPELSLAWPMLFNIEMGNAPLVMKFPKKNG